MTTYYIDPADGDDANSGTALDDAFATFGPVESDGPDALGPGDTVKLRDTAVLYPPSKPVWWKTTGTADQRIVIEAYGDDRPVIDCSNYDGHGIDLWGVQHMTWRGIEVRNVGRNAIRCSGTDEQAARNCRFEDMEIHHYGKTSQWDGNGLIFYGRSYGHTVRDVVAHHGADDGDSDGFYIGGSDSAGKSGGHTFVRCEAYRNADDGFDFFDNDPDRPSTMIDCLAHHNGDDGEGSTGDGNGFKVGGGWETGGNVLERCLAWENTTRGFDCNGASRTNEFYHCTAWNNGTYGFHFTGDTDPDHYARNCASFGNGKSAAGSTWNVDATANSWNLGIDRPQFLSTDADSADFLRPAADSPLVDAGVDVDMEFSGDAPDLGAVPSEGATGSTPTATLAVSDGGSFVEPVGVRYFDGSAWQGVALNVAQDGAFVQALGAVAYDGSSDSTSDSGSTDDGSSGSTDDGSGSTTTPSGVLEDFEGSLSSYAGDTGVFDVSTTRPYAGDGHLESSGDGAVWHTGLDTELDATYDVRVWQYAGTFAQAFCCVDGGSGKDDLSGYAVEVDFGWSKELALVRYDDGATTKLASTTCPKQPESWNRVEFSVGSDGALAATAFTEDGTEFASVSATDSTYTAGKLGFGASNSSVSFDDLRKR
jgi:hypothetical protein